MGSGVMNRTRRYVVAAWRAIASDLSRAGDVGGAADIYEFVDGFSPVKTEQEFLAAQHGLQITALTNS